MLLVIAYSCFTSAYYIAFSFPDGVPAFLELEHVVFGSYTLDIVFNFLRIPTTEVNSQKQLEMRSHLYIAKKYFKSGWLLLDLLATFPFYMLNNVNGIGFKMIRMVRIPKIFNLVD